jgi:hypothetical protein
VIGVPGDDSNEEFVAYVQPEHMGSVRREAGKE